MSLSTTPTRPRIHHINGWRLSVTIGMSLALLSLATFWDPVAFAGGFTMSPCPDSSLTGQSPSWNTGTITFKGTGSTGESGVDLVWNVIDQNNNQWPNDLGPPYINVPPVSQPGVPEDVTINAPGSTCPCSIYIWGEGKHDFLCSNPQIVPQFCYCRDCCGCWRLCTPCIARSKSVASDFTIEEDGPATISGTTITKKAKVRVTAANTTINNLCVAYYAYTRRGSADSGLQKIHGYPKTGNLIALSSGGTPVSLTHQIDISQEGALDPKKDRIHLTIFVGNSSEFNVNNWPDQTQTDAKGDRNQNEFPIPQ
jgi:hypothetical protein